MNNMFDLTWERYIPILDIGLEEISSILTAYDKAITVSGFQAIRLGCKNSNYVVETNKGKFLFRAASAAGLNNEIPAYALVKDKIPVPRLLFHTIRQQKHLFIYQYIPGVSLQKHIVEKGSCDYGLLEQVAAAAAVIHGVPLDDASGLTQWDVPPYAVWYEAFLENSVVRARIGEKKREKILRLVSDKQDFLAEIDGIRSFIHCDFRPVNMLVNQENQVFFVDWESASWGHSLADIGAFFRYRSLFNNTHIRLFEQTYRACGGKELPDNWYDLSLLRDLVNPLQLLSSPQEAPMRNRNLGDIIENTLVYWGYE